MKLCNQNRFLCEIALIATKGLRKHTNAYHAMKNYWKKNVHPTAQGDWLRMHDEILREDMIEIE